MRGIAGKQAAKRGARNPGLPRATWSGHVPVATIGGDDRSIYRFARTRPVG